MVWADLTSQANGILTSVLMYGLQEAVEAAMQWGGVPMEAICPADPAI